MKTKTVKAFSASTIDEVRAAKQHCFMKRGKLVGPKGEQLRFKDFPDCPVVICPREQYDEMAALWFWLKTP